MFSFGVNLDGQTQVLKVCASREEEQSHGLMKQFPGVLLESWVTYITTSPQVPTSHFLRLHRPSNTLYHLGALAHAVFSLWRGFPILHPDLDY